MPEEATMTLEMRPVAELGVHGHPQEFRRELALALYAQRRLSLGKGRKLAGLSLWEFRQ